MRTKEYRRYKASVKLEKRITNFYFQLGYWDGRQGSLAQYRKDVKKGVRDQWLKNTGVACSCFMCSGEYKYKRIKKCDIAKQVKAEVS